MADQSATADPAAQAGTEAENFPPVEFTKPEIAHGADMWRVARDSQKLDLNSSYAYLLWARDFAETSAVALVDGRVVGFVVGYRRPTEPRVLLIWQIAVDASQRGRGLAGKLLDHLVERLAGDVTVIETTVTPDNEASLALFKSLANRHSATMERASFLSSEDFPDDHEAEDLYRIEPLRVHP